MDAHPTRTLFRGVEQSATGRAWRDRLDERGNLRALSIIQRHGLPEILARVIAGRGIEPDEVEAFLDPTHPTPSVNITNHETSPGKYTVGTVRFDRTGMWTVRFHFYETCSDVPADSPHGHAAFFLNVP